MIKNTENHWSKLLIQQMALKPIIFHDTFLKENIIPWLFTDFYKLLRFSLTFYKIAWLFPDLEKVLLFPDFSPDSGNPVGIVTLYPNAGYRIVLPILWVQSNPDNSNPR